MGKLTIEIRNGSDAAYRSIHNWMERRYPKTGRCEHCGISGATDYAAIDHAYTRNREDWLELCRACHIILDGSPGAQFQRSKTHCPRGHPYDERNTRITPKGYRKCRQCHADNERARRARARLL